MFYCLVRCFIGPTPPLLTISHDYSSLSHLLFWSIIWGSIFVSFWDRFWLQCGPKCLQFGLQMAPKSIKNRCRNRIHILIDFFMICSSCSRMCSVIVPSFVHHFSVMFLQLFCRVSVMLPSCWAWSGCDLGIITAWVVDDLGVAWAWSGVVSAENRARPSATTQLDFSFNFTMNLNFNVISGATFSQNHTTCLEI